jgi:hypothetical protein
VALRTIADDGDILAFDKGEVAVLVVKYFHDFPNGIIRVVYLVFACFKL